jgi:hypothetical protein
LLRVVASGYGQKGQDASCAFLIENGTSGPLAESARFRIIAYDGAGVALKSDAGSISLVQPKQRLGIADAFSVPPDTTVVRCALELGPPILDVAPTLPLEASGAVVPGDPTPKVSGMVSNSAPGPIASVQAYAIAYDAQGNIVGGGSASVGDVPPNSRRAVQVPVATSAPLVEVELYAAPSMPAQSP